MLQQHVSTLVVRTPGRALVEITDQVRARVVESGIGEGLLTLFVRHTSASLLVQEKWEHRLHAHTREIAVHVIGGAAVA